MSSGTYGVVYDVIDTLRNNKRVALKEIPKTQNPSNRTLVQREVQVLKHILPACEPDLLCFVGFYETPNNYYIETALIPDAITLSRFIHDPRIVASEDIKATVIRRLIQTVAFMHDKQQVAHLDLKPLNILVSPEDLVIQGIDPSKWSLRFIDFGLGCVGTYCALPPGSAPGSLSYTAPDLFLSTTTMDLPALQNADIWSLGMIVYEMLTQQTVQEALGLKDKDAQYTAWLTSDAPVPPPDADAHDPFVYKAMINLLQKDPKKRAAAWRRLLAEMGAPT